MYTYSEIIFSTGIDFCESEAIFTYSSFVFCNNIFLSK